MTFLDVERYSSGMASTPTHRHLSVMVHRELMNKVDAYARRLHISRTTAVILLLTGGLAGTDAGAVQPALFDPAPEETP